jgi:hypothetical protein
VSGTTGLGEVRVQVRSTRSTAFTTSGELMFVTWSR